jgi:hypothetical protein
VWNLLNNFVYKKTPFLLRQGASYYPAIKTWRNIPQRLAEVNMCKNTIPHKKADCFF